MSNAPDPIHRSSFIVHRSSLTFTDSHCHLTMSNAEANLTAARAAGVRGFVVPATKREDAPQAVAIANANDDVWAAVGFHPHDAKHCDDDAFAEIARLAREQRVVAIGEIGLDYHYDHSPRDVQRAVFERHIALAKELDKPIIVHNRESTQDMVEILGRSGARGILHSYTESLDVARRLVDHGYFISFSGIVTFRSADSLREVARALPHDRVLIETDTPYLAPVPYRGRDNEPAYVVKIAELLAKLWDVPVERVAEQTTANFERAFAVKLPQPSPVPSPRVRGEGQGEGQPK
ncbi:MAG TPA: TatD family hydrolase [Thermoanaerobaculia bacterium]|nr:TatD family hydrolase [Thermoanaerobaculia bacterium]